MRNEKIDPAALFSQQAVVRRFAPIGVAIKLNKTKIGMYLIRFD
jgi:hypothetical protein